MSKVYEALKKAQREGQWRLDRDTLPTLSVKDLVPTDPPPAVEIHVVPPLPAGPAATEEEVTSESARNHLADSLLERDRRLNGEPHIRKPSDRAPPEPDAPLPNWSRSRKLGDRRRFRLREWAAPEALGPALIIHQKSLSRAGEQFQVLRATIEGWAFEHDKRVILITSALPGEGKSFVALNLAEALSHAGSEVLLVDADLRAPSLHLPFNLVPLAGLLPYLEGNAGFCDSITPTSSPRLRLIAAAGVTLSGPETFASPRMRALIQRARELKPPHFVLIDSPAALAGPEAQILSQLVDGVLVVVGANDTPRAAVIRTAEIIQGVPLFSLVLNRFQIPYSAARHLRYRAARYKLSSDA
jgi:Mrp family chromosome partitioning ATPase